MDDDIAGTPDGLLRCLQALAEEAACLSLSRTFAVLQDAIETCRAESERVPTGSDTALPAGLVH
jgi:hypothetical protein